MSRRVLTCLVDDGVVELVELMLLLAEVLGHVAVRSGLIERSLRLVLLPATPSV